MIFVNVKTLFLLMLFLEQAVGRPGARSRHVGDPLCYYLCSTALKVSTVSIKCNEKLSYKV